MLNKTKWKYHELLLSLTKSHIVLFDILKCSFKYYILATFFFFSLFRQTFNKRKNTRIDFLKSFWSTNLTNKMILGFSASALTRTEQHPFVSETKFRSKEKRGEDVYMTHPVYTQTLRLRSDLLWDNPINGCVNIQSVSGLVCVIDCPWIKRGLPWCCHWLQPHPQTSKRGSGLKNTSWLATLYKENTTQVAGISLL